MHLAKSWKCHLNLIVNSMSFASSYGSSARIAYATHRVTNSSTETAIARGLPPRVISIAPRWLARRSAADGCSRNCVWLIAGAGRPPRSSATLAARRLGVWLEDFPIWLRILSSHKYGRLKFIPLYFKACGEMTLIPLSYTVFPVACNGGLPSMPASPHRSYPSTP